MQTKMRIALIGTRGVPACYGGFETCVEEIGARFVSMGHDVTVYSRCVPGNENLHEYRGMKIVYVRWLPIKGFATLFASALSVFHAVFHQSFDIHMVFNGANSPVLPVLSLFGKKHALNTDGLEWQRDKWGALAKKYYKISEKVSVIFAKRLVSDSDAIAEYYRSTHFAKSTVIAYGANLPRKYADEKIRDVLNGYGLESRKYFIQITRFEPENSPLLSLQAFKLVEDPSVKYVLIGGSFETSYGKLLRQEAESDRRIILPGYIYDRETLEVLMTNSIGYVHGNKVGGTNPALLQAMAAGRPVVAVDCVFNREVLGKSGFYYERSVDSLKGSIQFLLTDSSEIAAQVDSNLALIEAKYNWDIISSKYEALFREIIKGIRV